MNWSIAVQLSLLNLANHISLHMLNWPYHEHATHDEIIGLILRGKVRPGDYYSHVMPMEEAPRAMQMIKTRMAFKVVVAM